MKGVCEWSNGGVTMTGKNRSARKKNFSKCCLVHIKSHGVCSRIETQASAGHRIFVSKFVFDRYRRIATGRWMGGWVGGRMNDG
jgi:hypothetical protein